MLQKEALLTRMVFDVCFLLKLKIRMPNWCLMIWLSNYKYHYHRTYCHAFVNNIAKTRIKWKSVKMLLFESNNVQNQMIYGRNIEEKNHTKTNKLCTYLILHIITTWRRNVKITDTCIRSLHTILPSKTNIMNNVKCA